MKVTLEDEHRIVTIETTENETTIGDALYLILDAMKGLGYFEQSIEEELLLRAEEINNG